MSTLYVDNLQPNLGSQVEIPDLKPNAGQIVQVQRAQVPNYKGSYSNTSLSYLADWYVDITPTDANNILVWKTTITMSSNVYASYVRFAVYEANSNTKWSSDSYIGAGFYQADANEWQDVTIMHSNIAGQTTPMRLQLFLLIGGSAGTVNTNWAGGDTRMIEVMEIAQ